MTEGKVSKWHKKVGDSVKEGDILAEIETDKAVQDFESEMNGTFIYRCRRRRQAPVDSVLAIIGNEGEDISSLIGGGSAASSTPEAPKLKKQKKNLLLKSLLRRYSCRRRSNHNAKTF
jgi:pyruvate dehydrogenase E2 component (dihydrolipoamide acetyltransferase)